MKGVRIVVFVGTFAAAAAIFGGCGTSRPNAGDPGNTPSTQERCTTQGQTRECKVVLAEVGGSRTCGNGTQTCAGGFWTACTMASGGTIESMNLGLAGITKTGVLKPMSVTPPSPDATACISPCDLNCVGYDEPCIPPADAGTGFASLYGAPSPTAAYAALPVAWQTLPTGSCSTGSSDPCGHDFYCRTGGGCNDVWAAGQVNTAVCAPGSGPDLTLAMPCKLVGQPTFTICNRGGDPANSGNVSISVSNAPFPQPQDIPQPSTIGSCTFDLTANPILPGQCRNFNSSICGATSFASIVGLKINDGASTISECMSKNNYTVYDPATAPTCVGVGSAGDGGVEAGADAGGCTTPPSQNPQDIIATPGTVPGFESKLLNDDCTGSTECDRFDPSSGSGPAEDSARMAYACQVDYYCEAKNGNLPGAKSGCCKLFNPGETHNNVPGAGATCTAGADLTVGATCQINGVPLIQVCNRGDTTVPTGTLIQLTEVGNPDLPPDADATSCLTRYNTAAPTCSKAAPSDILPGQCIKMLGDASFCPGGFPGGNRTYFLNPNATVAECTFDVKNRTPGPGVSDVAVNQPGCANNWTAWNLNSGSPMLAMPPCIIIYDPVVRTETYTQTCPPGQRAQWKEIGWDADVPGSGATKSMVIFEARTRQYLIDGGSGGFGPWTTIGRAMLSPPTAPFTLTTDGPGYCPMSGVANCPKSIPASMGAASISNELELRITLQPAASATASYAPTLRYWWLNRECVAVE